MVGRGVIDLVHDQTIALGELRLDAEYGVTEALGFGLMVPLRLVSTGITYRDLVGEPVELSRPGIHHRDETLFGAGDPWLLARGRGKLGRFRLGARAGVSVPLGDTENDPFAAGDAGLAHQHVQFGTGTVNPIGALDLGTTVGRFELSAYALTVQVVYPGARGYQAGDRYAGGLALGHPIGAGFRAALALDAAGETAERWRGERHDGEGNQGRFDLLAGASLARRLGDGVELRLGVKLPIVTRVVGGQLDYPALVDVGLRFALGAAARPHGHEGHTHEHGHAHGHANQGEHADDAAPAPAAGDDVVAIVTDGRIPTLTPVAGKLTVFDYWAAWCVPCRALDARLRELGRRFPGRLAIRKVDVVDWDSPVAAQLAGQGFTSLPHIKVLGEDGKLALEVGGQVDEIIEQVTLMLRRPRR